MARRRHERPRADHGQKAPDELHAAALRVRVVWRKIAPRGRDVLEGGAGNDYLDGGSGHDHLDGGAGDDFIKGGRGDDVITGGTGNDRLEGGEGTDTFMFDTESGHDIITDILQQDVLVFEGQEFHMEDLILSENSDGDVIVAFEGVDTSVTLEGVSIDDLDANHDGDPSDGYTISDDGSGVTITIDSTG